MSSPAPFHIRPFTPADAPAVIDIYNQARPIEVAQLTEDRFWSWFDDPELQPERDLLVAEDDQGPVGLVAAFPWPNHLAEGYVFFVGPSVLPDCQARGVGRALMEALAALVVERYPGKRLETRLAASNTRADEYLTRGLGFTVETRFWQMSHNAPGKGRVPAPPPGYAFEYLAPDADAADVVATYDAIRIGQDAPAAGRHLLRAEELANWASLGSFTASSFLVARLEGRVVGLCFTSFPRGSDHARVEFLGVLGSERGRGLASYLLARALDSAHQLGRHSVKLEVMGDASLPNSLYRKLGFELVGGETFYQRAADLPFSQRQA